MADEYIRRAEVLKITTRTCGDYAAAYAEIWKLPAADGERMRQAKMDGGLVFDTLLLIAFLQSDAETPEAAAEKFAKKLLDIPENVDLFAETPEERRARSDKWYAQEWEKIKQEIEEMKISEDTTRPGNQALG